MRVALVVALLVGCVRVASLTPTSKPSPAIESTPRAPAFELVVESPVILTRWKDAWSRLGLAPIAGRTFVVGMDRVAWLEEGNVVGDPSVEAGLPHGDDGRIAGWVEAILGRWPDAAYAQIGSTFFRWSSTRWEKIGTASVPFPRAVFARGGVVVVAIDRLEGFGLDAAIPPLPTTSIDLSLDVDADDDVELRSDDGAFRWSPGSTQWEPLAEAKPPTSNATWSVVDGRLRAKTPSGAWSTIALTHAAGTVVAREAWVVGDCVFVSATVARDGDDGPLDVLYRATTSSRP